MRLTLLEPRGKLDPFLMEDVLLLVLPPEKAPTFEAIKTWTPNEMSLAYDWAIREHLAAGDNPVRRRPRPSFIARAEIFMLSPDHISRINDIILKELDAGPKTNMVLRRAIGDAGETPTNLNNWSRQFDRIMQRLRHDGKIRFGTGNKWYSNNLVKCEACQGKGHVQRAAAT
jgi:hypothetical protein